MTTSAPRTPWHQPGWMAALRARAHRQQADLLARRHQRLLDTELHDTRRALWLSTRTRAGSDAAVLHDPDFLTVADRPVIYQAILVAALVAAHAHRVDLQLHDTATGTLTIVAQHGFTDPFLGYFATVDRAAPTACAAALTTGRPVLIDDITRSPLFAGQPTLAPLLRAGTRAVHSYPLTTSTGAILGVLSLHYTTTPATARKPVHHVIAAAAHALSHLHDTPAPAADEATRRVPAYPRTADRTTPRRLLPRELPCLLG